MDVASCNALHLLPQQVAERATKGGGLAEQRQKLWTPNVIVAHLEEGIEAVHLYTGRTICKLHLPSPGLHVDMNGDGVLDHLQAGPYPWPPYVVVIETCSIHGI
jgi:hypothetical protein